MSLPNHLPVDNIRRWEGEQTARLLGDTISMDEIQWHAPSLLPGWSRAHVATHLARGADAIGLAAVNARSSGHTRKQTVSDQYMELERGADRPGILLQIDLDTSAGALAGAWSSVTDWSRSVRLLGVNYSLGTLTLARLHEVCIHHLDLDLGTSLNDLEPETAAWLLRWVLHKMEYEPCPEVTVYSNSGITATFGRGEPKRHVRGSDAQLWAWLCGRVDGAAIEGATGLEFDLLS